jgi:hypothetical protein
MCSKILVIPKPKFSVEPNQQEYLLQIPVKYYHETAFRSWVKKEWGVDEAAPLSRLACVTANNGYLSFRLLNE